MAKDEAYYQAEKKIQDALKSGAIELDLSKKWGTPDKEKLTEIPDILGQLTHLKSLNLSNNQLSTIPDSIGQLAGLTSLNISSNLLIQLPDSLGKLKQLRSLNLGNNKLRSFPDSLGELILLISLDIGDGAGDMYFSDHLRKTFSIHGNPLQLLPQWIGNFVNLVELYCSNVDLTDLPNFVLNLTHLKILVLNSNPLSQELNEAYKQGIEGVKAYLRAKAESQLTLNEAKLILVGEGEVGKTCLMDALLGKPFQNHDTTHGIEIQSFNVTTAPQTTITLNAWDFGGQRVYRPTHQLFFSAPAVYLVVWKPREGSQAGQVKEWIQLVKRREPSAKILIVATHGGPQQRQPDIDRQELWDLFGRETVVDFFFVDSKPNAHGQRKGIDELKHTIAQVAASLPEVGRSVPKSFADVRQALQEKGAPYLPLREVLDICRTHNMDDEIARLFITISHRLGHLTHYENDPTLRDIVILRPDWLATAMSYVLDDEETRKNQGLVKFSRLTHLWNDPARPTDTRYPKDLHRIFLRLMERFDLSYCVAGLSKGDDSDPVSLIAQLVPDTTPTEDVFTNAWHPELAQGDIQQTQICRIVDAQSGQSANAEGLFYQLIVRLHRYSLGRVHYNDSVHWQRGLILDADYNGRALLRHIGNDVHITVRAAFPEYFLGMLTSEVKYLVESFWEGLRCDVTVPCIITTECKGLFEVSKLIENKKRGRPDVPCPICNEWQSIEQLLANAPEASKSISMDVLLEEFAQIKDSLKTVNISVTEVKTEVNIGTQRVLSQIDQKYNELLKSLLDEAKEGPRLFSLIPVKRSDFNPKEWASEKFKLILWCEHSRMPLPIWNGKDSTKGIFEIELTRDWFKKSAPLLKLMTSALSLALPVAASGLPLAIDKAAYDFFKDSIDFGKDIIDATLSASDKAELWKDKGDDVDLPHGVGIRAENATLRELQSFLKEKDPGFGGLVRVMNKRQEFLWVHEKFAGEY